MKFGAAVLASALALFSAPVGATVLSNFLTFDGGSGVGAFPPVQAGGEDKLQDDSLSRLVDTGPAGISAGDSIFGVLTLSEVLASGRPSVPVGLNSQIAILYAGTFVAGPGGVLGIAPNSALLLAQCGAACNGAGINAGTIAAFLSTTTPDTNPASDPLNWDALGANSLTANFNNVNGNGAWSWEMTAGLNEGQDFFQFSGNPILGGTNRAGLAITSAAFPATFLSVDVLDFALITHLVDLSLDVGTTEPASVNEQARGWTFRDQSSFFLNPTSVTVPEPESLALLALGLLGLAVSRRKVVGKLYT